jgi:hypothetical protein
VKSVYARAWSLQDFCALETHPVISAWIAIDLTETLGRNLLKSQLEPRGLPLIDLILTPGPTIIGLATGVLRLTLKGESHGTT